MLYKRPRLNLLQLEQPEITVLAVVSSSPVYLCPEQSVVLELLCVCQQI